jgi:hypothetical protein
VISEPDYKQPVTSTRPKSGSSTSYYKVGSNSVDYNYANLTQKEIDEINNNAASIFGGGSKKTDEAKVAKASFWCGVLDIAENLWDGLLWLSAMAADGQANQMAGASWSVSASRQISASATSVRDVAPLVEYDVSDAIYKNEMKKNNISEELAYGDIHYKYDTAGKIAGSVALSFIPGGAGSVVGGLTAVGS